MTLWELSACVDGWAKANGAEDKVPPPSAEEHLSMVERIRARRTVNPPPDRGSGHGEELVDRRTPPGT